MGNHIAETLARLLALMEADRLGISLPQAEIARRWGLAHRSTICRDRQNIEKAKEMAAELIEKLK
jgi:hypothetical protein